MDTSENYLDDYSSDESSNERSNDVAYCLFSCAKKRSYGEDRDYTDKRPKLEELDLIGPNTNRNALTYNVESSTLHGHQESSKEESNDVAACYQPLSADKHSPEEDGDYSVKSQTAVDLELSQPSTSEITSNCYNVVSSAPKKTLHGLTYQLRLLMLFVQRVPERQEFFLATEMHEAGLFDDIVLKYRQGNMWKYRFLQAKHKNDETYKIKKIDLFNKKSKSKKKYPSSKNVGETKPYLLKKYFESYCVIKENIFFKNANLEEFLICTNVGFDDEAMDYFECTRENDHDPIFENRIGFEKKYPVKFILRKEKILELKEDFEINRQNENCFSNFVKKFRFLTNYEDSELNENIQHYLKEYLKIENVDLANGYFQNRVLKWFETYKDKKSNYLHIKDKEEFLKSLNSNIESLLVAGYSTFYFEELKSCEVKFENILPLREFFGQKSGRMSFVITRTAKLSVIKLSQLFNKLKLRQDEFILTNADKLRDNKKISTTFFAESSYKWLVVEYYHNDIKLEREILNKILKIDNKKTIVIIGWEESVLNFRQHLPFDTPCFYDKNNSFKDLRMVSQEKILERPVIFQEKEVNLNQLINIDSGRNIIDEQILEKLLSDKIKIGNNKAFSSDFFIEDCYIRRKLSQRSLKLHILQNVEVLKSCLFFIFGVNIDQLKHLKINNNFIFTWEKGKIYTNGIILCNKMKYEDRIIELYTNKKENLCWLEYLKGKFLIMNIRNETDMLHKYICLEEYELDNKDILEKKIIILADGPGSGKSMFMTEVARQLRQVMSNIWILRINLSYYAYKQKDHKQAVTSLEDIKFKDHETNRAIEFMANLLFPQQYKKLNKLFARILLTQSLYYLNGNMRFPKIILLFDGFDEISPTFKERTLTLLKALLNSNVAQMWITTRTHEELSLEVALHSSSFFLRPLDVMEKIDFIQKLWKYNLVNFDNIEPKPDSKDALTYLTEIIDNICNCDNKFFSSSFRDFREHWLPVPNCFNLKASLSNINFSAIAKYLIFYFERCYKDIILEFIANPLQLKMIAEMIVFKKFISFHEFDIFSLYEEFLKYKWKIFRDDKNAAGKTEAGHGSFRIVIKYLTTVHQKIAFKRLFRPHDTEEFMEGYDKIELSRAGLLLIHDDRLEFVHRSFAEYFVSQYFAENFHWENIQKIIFSDVLTKENYSLIRKFLNGNATFLEKLSCKTPQMIEIITTNGSGSGILHQMLIEDLYNLFVKFLENLPLNFSKLARWFDQDNYGKTVLHRICEYTTDEQILENILKAIKDSVSSETLIKLFFQRDKEQRTALHCINFYGKNSVVKQKLQFFKLNCMDKLFYELLLQVDKAEDTILNIACARGQDITDLLEVSDENRDVISKLLLKTDNGGRTALYFTVLHSDNPSLVTTLLNLIKSVCNITEIKNLFALKIDSCNLLHTVCCKRNKDILVNFLSAIKDNKEIVEKLVLETDRHELTPLHCLVSNLYNFDMLKILLDFVKLNCSREMLHTLLCKSICDGTTILHIAMRTCKYGHDSLTLLLTYLFNLVENNKEIFYRLLLTTDKHGRTILFYYISQLEGSFLLKELLDFVRLNCDEETFTKLILKCNKNGRTVLHIFCLNDNREEILTYLLNLVKDNTTPKIFKTFLSTKDCHGKVASDYIERNADNSALLGVLLNFIFQLLEIVDDSQLVDQSENSINLLISESED